MVSVFKYIGPLECPSVKSHTLGCSHFAGFSIFENAEVAFSGFVDFYRIGTGHGFGWLANNNCSLYSSTSLFFVGVYFSTFALLLVTGFSDFVSTLKVCFAIGSSTESSRFIRDGQPRAM